MPATLVIPQHGRADLTLDALASILRHEAASPRILLIDDGSPDDSADRIAAQLPNFQRQRPDIPITFLRQPHRGLTAAWNHAARQATSEVLVFLNNDVLAHGPFLNQLIAPLQTPHIHATNARRPRPAGFPRMTGPRLRRESHLPPHILSQLPTTTFLDGWCFAVRRDDFDTLGGFDESMRLYWSDTDLQCRLVQRFHSPDHGDPAFLQPVFDLALRHLGHQTAHAQPAHRQQWRQDRAAFLSLWRTS